MSTFLWGASTSPHQTEGDNVNSDWWTIEQTPSTFVRERSGDAVDSYHRYGEEMRLLAEAGLNAYRFGIEWARIEPEPGRFSRAALAHYRRMIDTARGLGLTPVVTLHHFSNPRWFGLQGGWQRRDAVELFRRYTERASDILGEVEWVCTINEPNMVALMARFKASLESGEAGTAAAGGDAEATRPRPRTMPLPDITTGEVLAQAHHAATAVLRERTDAAVGWTVAQQAFTPEAGHEEVFAETVYAWEDLYLQAARGDDFIGAQSYTSQPVGPEGPRPHPQSPDNTLKGWAYRPDALGIAVRRAWDVARVPVLVTENGIATDDDTRRIAYTSEALRHLGAAMADGVDVRGYLHWSAVDNYEWGSWRPTFGLISVDRETFERTPKPSLAWLGEVARGGRPDAAAHPPVR
ncbi:glycoside hydrolase family 1 protein [Streptomyces sp. FH025]|uniref:glycoside hydrolase family 1 protein n=1 Tax=Streptomyces sp. FH025 TaxID=2815937 RepID=UPI001A9E6A26|nr:family 1 glycosylhydrolase [Streptomyces sp. FH025]MBO1419974.1 glycoside hydrolase family 1 protein [Streptomyces sp. FH025]